MIWPLHTRVVIILLILPFFSIAQKTGYDTIDSTIRSYKALYIQGKKFDVFLTDRGCFVLDAKRDTVCIKVSEDYVMLKVDDFNKDGLPDIFLYLSGNTPEVYDLLLYNIQTRKFKPVKDFNLFPAPIGIPGSKYYYSYHKKGCADLNWASDLFYLDHFRCVRIGNILGNGCLTADKKTIDVFKVKGAKKRLLKTLPMNIIGKYKDNKWGFIGHYWSANYRNFL